MADKCECGHYEPSHQFQKKNCFICPCEKFVKVEPEPEPEPKKQPYIQTGPGKRRYFDPKPFQETAEYPSLVDRDTVIPVLNSIAKTLHESGYQKASDYVSGYRDTIETQPAVKQEPLSDTEAGGVLLVLDMLSRSHECWCAAGTSELIPDHNEICIKVRALYESMGRKERKG